MTPAWTLALLCLSPVSQYGNITIANRLPVACTAYLGSPPWPVTELPAPVAPPVFPSAATEKAAEAVPVEKATTPAKKAKKPARRSRCKPGRTRNMQGICGRWR